MRPVSQSGAGCPPAEKLDRPVPKRCFIRLIRSVAEDLWSELMPAADGGVNPLGVFWVGGKAPAASRLRQTLSLLRRSFEGGGGGGGSALCLRAPLHVAHPTRDRRRVPWKRNPFLQQKDRRRGAISPEGPHELYASTVGRGLVRSSLDDDRSTPPIEGHKMMSPGTFAQHSVRGIDSQAALVFAEGEQPRD